MSARRATHGATSRPIDWSRLDVTPTSVSDGLSARLEQMILDGVLAPGGRLPSERELQSALGVSRVSIREALHALELKGLVDRRPGRGTIVVAPDRSARTGTMLARLSAGERDLLEVMDFRAAIEPPIAARAAGRATANDVRALRDLIDQMESSADVAGTIALDEAFHAAIARAAHNPLLVALLETATEWMAASRGVALQSRRRRSESIAAHRRIVDAIAAGDPDTAGRAMADHIDGVNRLLAQCSLGGASARPGRARTEAA